MITSNYTSSILCESPWYWFHQASIIVSSFLLSVCVIFGVLLTLTRIRMQRFTYGFHFNVTMIQMQVNYTLTNWPEVLGSCSSIDELYDKFLAIVHYAISVFVPFTCQ
uniref:G_PROTEIN_RECEP_F1_2 domain-containing protein n=1 Tax=Panagrellus redivivus TaxID=6233 RepID=A0A7E4V6R2_PANRE